MTINSTEPVVLTKDNGMIVAAPQKDTNNERASLPKTGTELDIIFPPKFLNF